jgi:alpha-galactosidase
MEQFSLVLRVSGIDYQINTFGYHIFEPFSVEVTEADANDHRRIVCQINPKTDIYVQDAVFSLKLPKQALDSPLIAHGYQSCSATTIRRTHAPVSRLSRFAYHKAQYSGDAKFHVLKDVKRFAHAWSWCEIDGATAPWMILSAAEKTGFTLFWVENDAVHCAKDLQNLSLNHSFCLFDLIMTTHSLSLAVEAFSDALEIRKPEIDTEKPTELSWTSPHHLDIDSITLQKRLLEVKASHVPFTYFLVDDGWQKTTGDWMQWRAEKFAEGLTPLVRNIKAEGLKAGLYLAPFAVSAQSQVFSEHPNWLQRSESGKPIIAGCNAQWGGDFYALDFYNPKAREYLAGILYQASQIWSFDLLKLDLLYIACIAPPANKTRGQVMHEAMEFMRKAAGKAEIWASGLPLAAGLGYTDFCSISGDAKGNWRNKTAHLLAKRESLGTLAAVRNTLLRFWMNGTVCKNATGHFSLQSEQSQLNARQKHTVLMVNAVFGSMLTISDQVSEWSIEIRSVFDQALYFSKARVTALIQPKEDVFIAHLSMSTSKYKMYINLTNRAQHLEGIELLAHQTQVVDLA